jgi:hypothetical protein
MGYAWGMHAAVPRQHPYPSSTRYRYNAQIAVPVLPSLLTTLKGEKKERELHPSCHDSEMYPQVQSLLAALRL